MPPYVVCARHSVDFAATLDLHRFRGGPPGCSQPTCRPLASTTRPPCPFSCRDLVPRGDALTSTSPSLVSELSAVPPTHLVHTHPPPDRTRKFGVDEPPSLSSRAPSAAPSGRPSSVSRCDCQLPRTSIERPSPFRCGTSLPSHAFRPRGFSPPRRLTPRSIWNPDGQRPPLEQPKRSKITGRNTPSGLVASRYTPGVHHISLPAARATAGLTSSASSPVTGSDASSRKAPHYGVLRPDIPRHLQETPNDTTLLGARTAPCDAHTPRRHLRR